MPQSPSTNESEQDGLSSTVLSPRADSGAAQPRLRRDKRLGSGYIVPMDRQSNKHNRRLDDEISDPFPGGERMTRAELDFRHDLARYIERRAFPGTREDIVASAKRLHAPLPVIERLEMLPSAI